MAAVMATARDASAALCASEEALLDAYDLEWKAIDIRMDKLRNECERMLLEYELELKQAMYVRECEELVRQQQARHEAERAGLERELAASQQHASAAEKETRRLQQTQQEENKLREAEKRREEEEVERQRDADEAEATVAKRKQKKEAKEVDTKSMKPTAKRKQSKAIADVQEPEEEPLEKPKTKTAGKKGATVKPVERPASPPVYSPEEEEDEQRETAPAEPPVSNGDLSEVADDDLLAILTQDNGYESEDFGDASALSLIHPESPAMLSPKRLKKKAAFEAARLAKINAESPLRGGEAALADRLMNRIRAVSKQPLGEPDAQSDVSISPPPLLTPPPKRALKRRKTGALSPAPGITGTKVNDKSSTGTEEDTTHTRDANVKEAKQKSKKPTGSDNRENDADTEKKPQPEPHFPVSEKPKKTKKLAKKAFSGEDEVVPNESNQGDGVKDGHVDEVQKKNSAPKKDMNGTKTTVKAKKARKEVPTTTDGNEEHLQAEDVEHDEAKTQELAAKPDKYVGAVTGRSKARQSAKRAALQAAAEDSVTRLTGFAAIHDIKTPKVPRKKMGIDGKKKQSNDLAAKRAEFQQILNENSNANRPEERSEAVPPPGKKRRRNDPVMKEPVELEFHTPKPKAKKSKVAKNPFPHDELNIMKSPVPLLRAKIAEKKKQAEEESKTKKAKKRTVSQRDDADEEDPGYGSPAVDVPVSSVLPATQLPPPISIKPISSQTPSRKSPDEITAAASEYASRWLNSGLVTRAKKNAVKTARKPVTKTTPKPPSVWGGGASFFDAFVNSGAPVIPRLKSSSSAPKL